MGTGKQMNRLLQGDVGSGKTMVALLTMLIALDNNFQTCMMAPTEIFGPATLSIAIQRFRKTSHQRCPVDRIDKNTRTKDNSSGPPRGQFTYPYSARMR